MKLQYMLRMICAALAVTSCAPMPPRLQEVQVPPERITQTGYSFVPLNEQGWLIAGRNPYQVSLVRRGENPDETFAIQATPIKLPTFKSREDMVRVIKEEQTKDTNPSRFKLEKHEVNAYFEKVAYCVRSHMVTKDNAAVKRSGKTGDMILGAMSLMCAHPKDRNVGVSVTYSHRYYPDQNDPKFIEKASRILNSVEFSEF